jgi:acetolactate synthase-1/2/3 large subunit
MWQVIKGEDWVLTANTLKEWVHKIWDFDKPYRHVGRELGTGPDRLVHRCSTRTRAGKLVIDCSPTAIDVRPGALWTGKYDVMLIVMYNNRAYYNDWAHQIHWRTTRHRSARAYIGMDLKRRPISPTSPKAWVGIGAIEDPGGNYSGLKRAIAHEGRQAGVVDV